MHSYIAQLTDGVFRGFFATLRITEFSLLCDITGRGALLSVLKNAPITM